MKIEQHFIDKTQWTDGPWKTESDRVSWIDPETGYSCIILRHSILGNYCGYVAISKDHPLYMKDYNEVEIECHGGLTYSRECDGDVEKGVCHTTTEGDKAWWFGFDCAHANYDLLPGPDFPRLSWIKDDDYRDLAYVTSQVESMAKQLKDKD